MLLKIVREEEERCHPSRHSDTRLGPRSRTYSSCFSSLTFVNFCFGVASKSQSHSLFAPPRPPRRVSVYEYKTQLYPRFLISWGDLLLDRYSLLSLFFLNWGLVTQKDHDFTPVSSSLSETRHGKTGQEKKARLDWDGRERRQKVVMTLPHPEKLGEVIQTEGQSESNSVSVICSADEIVL